MRVDGRLGAILLALAATTAQAQTPGESAELQITASPFLVFEWAEELSADAALTDIDKDGDLDIVVANGRHWPQFNAIYLNNGKGRMLEMIPLGVTATPSYQVIPADLDRDGRIDLVVINDGLPARVHLADERGGFGAGHAIAGTGGNARGAAIADLDGDGLLDLAIARRGEADLLALGTGDGGFAAPAPLGGDATRSIRINAADIDADGDTDLLISRRDGQASVVARNDGAGTFTEIPLPAQVGASRELIAVDLKCDGRLALVSCSLDGRNVIMQIGAGKAEIIARFGAADDGCYAIGAADFDGDGRMDFVVGNSEHPNYLYRQHADLSFERIIVEQEPHGTYGLAIGDVNGDGTPDVVFANSEAPNAVYLVRKNNE